MALPTFDMTKFYRVRCTSGELSSMFATLHKLDDYVAAQKARKTRVTLIGLVALAVCFVAASAHSSGVAFGGLALSRVGLVFVICATLVRFIFGPPSSRFPRAAALILLILAAPFGLLFAGPYWAENSELFSKAHPLDAALIAALGTGSVVWMLFIASGRRWPALSPQQFELSYLKEILSALFGDLPKKTRGDVVFNPFRGQWSQVQIPVRSRSGYTIDATADILLQLRLPLDEHRDLRLSIIEQAVSKTKIRKGKYKGTKRRVIVRYVMSLPPEVKLDDGKALQQQLPAGIFSRVVVTDGKLTVMQVKKTAGMDQDLGAQHLVSSAQVLETIRLMSQASMPPATVA